MANGKPQPSRFPTHRYFQLGLYGVLRAAAFCWRPVRQVHFTATKNACSGLCLMNPSPFLFSPLPCAFFSPRLIRFTGIACAMRLFQAATGRFHMSRFRARLCDAGTGLLSITSTSTRHRDGGEEAHYRTGHGKKMLLLRLGRVCRGPGRGPDFRMVGIARPDEG